MAADVKKNLKKHFYDSGVAVKQLLGQTYSKRMKRMKKIFKKRSGNAVEWLFRPIFSSSFFFFRFVCLLSFFRASWSRGLHTHTHTHTLPHTHTHTHTRYESNDTRKGVQLKSQSAVSRVINWEGRGAGLTLRRGWWVARGGGAYPGGRGWWVAKGGGACPGGRGWWVAKRGGACRCRFRDSSVPGHVTLGGKP